MTAACNSQIKKQEVHTRYKVPSRARVVSPMGLPGVSARRQQPHLPMDFERIASPLESTAGSAVAGSTNSAKLGGEPFTEGRTAVKHLNKRATV